MATIINSFPSMTRDWLLHKCSFQEFFLWHDRAIELKTGKKIDRQSSDDDKIIEEVYSEFTWSEEYQRYI